MGYTIGLQLSSSCMYFYFLFFCDKNDQLLILSCRFNEIPKLINLFKNGTNTLKFVSVITNLPGASAYKLDH